VRSEHLSFINFPTEEGNSQNSIREWILPLCSDPAPSEYQVNSNEAENRSKMTPVMEGRRKGLLLKRQEIKDPVMQERHLEVSTIAQEYKVSERFGGHS
jgi:hypothetical protein